MGDDLSIVRAARLSYDQGWRTGEDEGKDANLIGYLLKNKHTSPFEHVKFTFEVKCPMFIGEQWLRHRMANYSKISGRYTELPEEYYIPSVDQITTQSSDNKQMRTEIVNENAAYIQQIMNEENAEAFHTYQALLRLGCPRELARSVLPAATYTRMIVTMDLHNLMHFLRLRLHPHAQYEIRVYAQAIMQLIYPIVPITMAYFKESLNVESS